MKSVLLAAASRLFSITGSTTRWRLLLATTGRRRAVSTVIIIILRLEILIPTSYVQNSGRFSLM